MLIAIAAVTENWGIGKDGCLLFHIHDDMKHFRKITEGCPIIMGRKTLETFPDGKPLIKRENIVLTHNKELFIQDATIKHNIREILYAVDDETAFVVGGDSIYKQFLPYCNSAIITKIYERPEADAYFPNLDEMPEWRVTDKGKIKEENGIKFQYIDYERI